MSAASRAASPLPPVASVTASAFTIPTEQPERDGTLEWTETTLLIVEARAGDTTGVGYSYAHPAAVDLVVGKLAAVVEDSDSSRPGSAWAAMWETTRNLGQTGLVSAALSAVDVALWDLKARLLDRSLVELLDGVHDSVKVYGSGGFCNYTDSQLADQLSGWVESGIPRVKMKVGAQPEQDEARLRVARRAIGADVELYVDANGAFTRADAIGWAERYATYDVRWYEEPVSSDDLAGLRLVRDRAPGGLCVAAGEYGWNLGYFQRMLDAEAVDCLQADVTRCGGISGLLRVAALCDARSLDLSAHCAPQVSAHACTAVWHLRHLEYFHDHDRIEHLAFDGCLEPEPGGRLRPDRSRPGMGLEVRWSDLEQWRSR